MSLRNRLLSGALAALLLAAALAAPAPAAAPAAAPEDSSYFRVVTPAQPTDNPKKIEVIEFFSYGCPHCAHFYPLITAWAAKLPKDVELKRVPISFNRREWENLQRAFYALQATGDLAKLDGPLFHAIHEEQLPLFYEQPLADWIAKNGGDADAFTKAYVSLGVNTQTVQADAVAVRFGVDAIPAMAVDGKYLAQANPDPGEMPYLKELLENTDRLIARVRAERGPAAASGKPR